MKLRHSICKVISICTLILLLLSPFFAHSHPGRTDANGGHWNRETGEYHFHTGEYAGRNSGSSSTSNYRYKSFTPPYKPPTENPYNSENTEKSTEREIPFIITVGGIISLIFFAIPTIIMIVGGIIAVVTTIFHSLYVWILGGKTPNKALEHFDNAIRDFFAIHEKYIEAFNLENEFQKVPFPDEYDIGSDGLPCEKKSGKWGKTFTVYRTSRGNKLHLKYKCCHATIKSHICNQRYCHEDIYERLCKKCFRKSQVPDLKWYENHLEHQKLIKITDAKYEHLKRHVEYLKTIYKKYNSTRMTFFMNLRSERKTKHIQLNNRFLDVITFFNNVPTPCHQPYSNIAEKIDNSQI